MVITPNTNIKLLKVELTLDNKNQLTFANKEAQYNYFNSLPKLELEDNTYQRKDNAIRYNGKFDDLLPYNYCMYQNENYSNKWFYAFVTNIQYVNDNMSFITIKTDVFQTWQFDLTYKNSFVEREMINVSDDTPGANLIPENLETGEYKVQGTDEIDNLEPAYICAYTGDKITLVHGPLADPNQAYENNLTNFYDMFANGIPCAVHFIATTNKSDFANLIYSLQTFGNQSEKVVALFTVPKFAVTSIFSATNQLRDYQDNIPPKPELYVLTSDATVVTENLVQLPTTIDGYTVKNQKLRTFPYTYLGFNPPSGSSKVFRYEDFTNLTPSFNMYCEINPNPTAYFIPQNYRGATGNSLSDSVTLNGYPQLASRIDVYNSWLAENTGIINVEKENARMNYQYDVIGGTVGLLGSVANMLSNASQGNEMGGGLTNVTNAGISLAKTQLNYDYFIKSLQAQQERQQMLPDNVTLGGSNATLLGYDLINDNIFTRYSIKRQFAERIDKFFDMFGYATNNVKTPNLNNRPNWNYIKTQGINIIADIPEWDLQEIKSMYDNGVTLWHNPSTYLDYSQNNR